MLSARDFRKAERHMKPEIAYIGPKKLTFRKRSVDSHRRLLRKTLPYLGVNPSGPCARKMVILRHK